MADLRDQTFIPTADSGEILSSSAAPLASEPIVIEEPIEKSGTLYGEDGESGLAEYRVVDEDEDEPGSNTVKIVGGIAVALLVGAAVVYGYEVSTNKPTAPMMTQTATNMPAPAPAPMAPPAPPPQASAAPAPQPEAAATEAPALKAHSVRTARHEAKIVPNDALPGTAAPSQTAQSAAPAGDSVLPVTPSEPVSPPAPASSVASNPASQSLSAAPDAAAPAAPADKLVPPESQSAAPAPVQPVLPQPVEQAAPSQTAPAQQQ